MTGITATYNPPPKVEGTVSIDMPAAQAQKLLALLGRANGDHFDELYGALNVALPKEGRMALVSAISPASFSVDLHGKAKFILE
jgi:hypothetical protein